MDYDESAYTGLLVTRSTVFRPPRPDAEEDARDRPDRKVAARLAAHQRWQALREVLGPLHVNTTVLPTVDGTQLGPATGRDGRPLRWTVWAPARRVLIDIFPRPEHLPSKAELEDRQAFARANGVRYALAEPGRTITMEALKEWLG